MLTIVVEYVDLLWERFAWYSLSPFNEEFLDGRCNDERSVRAGINSGS